MAGSTVLVFDVPCCCYSFAYAIGRLSYGGEETTAFYGLMRNALYLMDIFQTRRVVWAFDGGCDNRRVLYPEYKRKRRENENEEVKQFRMSMRRQLYKIRIQYLPEIGFRNILVDEGYEADDCIASFINYLPRGDEAIIVSSDEDLFQLLRDRVSIRLPKGRMVTVSSFVEEYGIDPSMWADVKSLAGCESDGVKGVDGVGHKKAIQFLTGKMNPKTKAYKSIVEGGEIWKRNLSLVRLPFPGVQKFFWVPDELDDDKWCSLCDMLGFRSLMGVGWGRNRG